MTGSRALTLDMTGVERTDYVRRSLALMEDTDWSAYGKLRDVTLGEQVAAALGLYERYGMRHPDAEDMIRMLLGRVSYYEDAGALANAEQQPLMDLLDALKFPHHLLTANAEQVVESMRQIWEERRWVFVDLSARTLSVLGFSGELVDEGYYVFSSL
jgi:hypothetical protein